MVPAGQSELLGEMKSKENRKYMGTVSPLHMNLQVANFQTCPCMPAAVLYYYTFQGTVP